MNYESVGTVACKGCDALTPITLMKKFEVYFYCPDCYKRFKREAPAKGSNEDET